jgi:hypothetical protein
MKRTGLSLLLCLCVAFAGVAFSADQAESEKAATDAASPWLALVDSGQYGESWFQAATLFRNSLSKEQWKNALDATRAPLGKVVTRQLRSATYTTKLPNVPAGEYVIIEYDTGFSNAPGMIETVIPMKEKDGKWKVSGYFIKRTGG